ncbi:SWIM zinc finger family protein [Actinocorallia sp. B10E7]|uniref:SWIM zinc finger family protein n=1 Tax=Actinocorallia sp. B10E7 TaxID=3153558 RepID=UPI00325ED63C
MSPSPRVEGGLKARKSRGSIGERWWSRRFIDVMEEIADSGRLARGRTYARKGQVRDLQILPYKVTSLVQGSRSRPYKVSVTIHPIPEDTWAEIEEALAGQAIFRAKLLAGEMPPEIEELFDDHDTPLFPTTRSDIDFVCSCPDWGDPCKHVAATLYLLAEAFDDDPFLVLAWNGRTRERLLSALRANAPADRPATALFDVTDQPLEDSFETFWTTGVSLTRLREHPDREPGPSGLMLRLLGDQPLRIRGTRLTDLLAPSYETLAEADPA